MKTILVDAVNTFVDTAGNIFGAMHDLLEEYPNNKIILTGADDKQFTQFGLDKMPYEVFTLKHEPEKTDPDYFKMMLDNYELTPEDVIYFEHNIDAVESAKSVGIETYHYDKDIKDLDGLQDFLNENL